jgi:cardiolipin synthase (CMP-forming)
MSFFNAPNSVTLIRILLILPFLWALSVGEIELALGIFVVISLLDSADGFLARYTNQASKFGEVFDGMSDVIILIIAFLSCAKYGYIAKEWHVLLIVIPSFLLLTKIYHAYTTKEAEHTIPGKINAFLDYLTIIWAIARLPYFSVIIWSFFTLSLYTAVTFGIKAVLKGNKDQL